MQDVDLSNSTPAITLLSNQESRDNLYEILRPCRGAFRRFGWASASDLSHSRVASVVCAYLLRCIVAFPHGFLAQGGLTGCGRVHRSTKKVIAHLLYR